MVSLQATPTITRISLPNGRHYRVEGFEELFPSVTNVLGVIAKPALVAWARDTALEAVREALTDRTGMMVAVTPDWVSSLIEEARARPDQVRDGAADFGTQAHVLIDEILSGEEPEIPAQMSTVVASFEGWRRYAGLDIHLTETLVYSAKYRYAGAMDALASRGDTLVALDWKTGNRIYPEFDLQVAAYAKALEEMSGQRVAEAWIVRLGKRVPEFEARTVKDLDRAFDAFRAALFLWRAVQG